MTSAQHLNEDAVFACAHLVDRAGAQGFELGYLDDDPTNPRWYAVAKYQGARITTENHQSPTTAVMALAERLLADAMCRCGQPVSLSDATPGCRWRLMGRRWESGCDAEPVTVDGKRGDLAAMQRAMGNRAARRAADRRNRRQGGQP